MASVTFTLDDEQFAALEKLAREQNTTIESLLQQAANGLLRQAIPIAPELNEVDYPDWLKEGLFDGGTEVTGRNAETILDQDFGNS